jgi:hypothetical protein
METIMDYIAIAIAIYAAFRAGVIWHRFYFAFIIEKYPEHLERLIKLAKEDNLSPSDLTNVLKEEATEEAKDGTELAIERHGDMLYAFAKNTDQFIAQGSNLDILLAEASKRFPDRRFFGNITSDNPAKELA